MWTGARWICIAALLAGGCGGGRGAPAVPDTAAPVARLLFPPAAAVATTPTLAVSGTAGDDRGVTAVTVNGVAATSADGFATWRAEVPLGAGVTTIRVGVRDAAGNRADLEVDVTRVAAVLAAPGGIAYDAAGGRALVVDRALGALLAVDLATGALSLVTEALAEPQGVVLDAAGNRALVVDSGLQALVAVDLGDGTVTVLSDATTGSGPALQGPRALDYHAPSNQVLVVDSVARSLLRIPLATGERVLIAAGLANPQGVRLDVRSGGAFVTEGTRLTFVDIGSGLTAEFAGSGPAFGNAIGLALDLDANRALVVDALLGAVLAVDLSTGERSVVTDNEVSFPAAIDLDPASGRAVVADPGRDAVFDLDPATSAIALVAGSSFGDGAPLVSPRDVALDGEAALVADFARGLVSVATDRTEIDGGGPPFQVPLGVAVDGAARRAFVADSAAGALFAVDLGSGARAVLADALAAPTGVAHDPARDRAVVLDGTAFVDVDLATGVGIPLPAGSGPALDVPRGFALDAAAGRLLVADDGRDALLAVDLATGVRTQVAGGFAVPTDVAHDPAGRAFVVDAGRDEVLVVDLATGALTPLAGSGPPLLNPVAVAFDGRILVVDAGLGALLAVDPATGDRVVLSK